MSSETSTTPSPNLAATYAEVAQKAAKLVTQYVRRNVGRFPQMPSDDVGVARTFMDLSSRLISNPTKVWDMQMSLIWDHYTLWQNSVFRVLGVPIEPVAKPEGSDRRFKNDLWENNLLFDFIKQSYLIATHRLRETVLGADGLEPAVRSKANFFTQQFLDALAPTNFALTNPQVIHEIVETGGQNLLNGLNNLLRDIDHKGQLRVRMTDASAFELGKNVATTPGKVVFQNELFQLIQYQPSTDEVSKRPLLIIPPWINKYYILDLTEKNSFIKWCVGQGFTTYIVSWVNPDKKLAKKSFEDYLLSGAYEALQQTKRICGVDQVDLASYCIGGTLTSTLLAYLAARGEQDQVASAVFFTTLIDFSQPGELGVFLGEETIEALVAKMEKRGYLDGAEMANTFNTLRQNDLIWSFVINNYLLGKQPFPFDLLYWNSDSTRMPAAMHSYYLRNMYLENKLKDANGLTMGGQPIDIRSIKVPCYFLSTLEDHIAPWKSTYLGARLPSGPVTFVLGGSGHIAGVVNPPAANKYGYWLYDGSSLPENPDDFLENARKQEGSWWPHWRQWVKSIGDGAVTVKARRPGDNGVTLIEDAPGSYAKTRLDAAPSKGQAAPVESRTIAAVPQDAAKPMKATAASTASAVAPAPPKPAVKPKLTSASKPSPTAKPTAPNKSPSPSSAQPPADTTTAKPPAKPKPVTKNTSTLARMVASMAPSRQSGDSSAKAADTAATSQPTTPASQAKQPAKKRQGKPAS